VKTRRTKIAKEEKNRADWINRSRARVESAFPARIESLETKMEMLKIQRMEENLVVIVQEDQESR